MPYQVNRNVAATAMTNLKGSARSTDSTAKFSTVEKVLAWNYVSRYSVQAEPVSMRGFRLRKATERIKRNPSLDVALISLPPEESYAARVHTQ